MTTLSERLMEKGIRQGMQQGEAAALLKLITQKFGPLPDWAEDAVQNATFLEIEAWLEKVLTADSLENLLA